MVSTPEPTSSSAEAAPQLLATWLGRMAFAEALQLQLDIRERVIVGDCLPTLLLVEHPPTLTKGRRGRDEHILWSREQLASHDVQLCDAPRGGELTLHAPGQLVVYPIVPVGRAIRAHVERMACVAIELVRELGIVDAVYRRDHPGVWVGAQKLASVGVHISRGVSVQGLALNMDVDMRLFDALISCGLPGVKATSVVHLGGVAVPLRQAAVRYAQHYAQVLGCTLEWQAP